MVYPFWSMSFLPFLPSKTESTMAMVCGPVTRITAMADIPPPVAKAQIVEFGVSVLCIKR